MDVDPHYCHVLRMFLIVVLSACIRNTGCKGFNQASRRVLTPELRLRYFMIQHQPWALTNHRPLMFYLD